MTFFDFMLVSKKYYIYFVVFLLISVTENVFHKLQIGSLKRSLARYNDQIRAIILAELMK